MNSEEVMAEADTGFDPVSLFPLPVSHKLQARLNQLKEVIENQKMEVRRIGREMRRLIEEKENEIIKELDSIWNEANARIDRKKEEVQKKIEEIEKRNKEMSKNYDEMKKLFKEINQTLPPHSLPQISEAVKSAKREFDHTIPYLNLSWRVDVLRHSINGMCHVEQVFREETTPFQLTWIQCERGDEEVQLHYPSSIAINYVNGNIYATDYYKNRVQIFSKEGEWIRSLKNEGIMKPLKVLIQADSIYLMCCHLVLNFHKSEEKIIESSKDFDFSLRGICADKSHIYVSTYTGMKLIFFTHKLIEQKQITLNPQSYLYNVESNLRDMALAREEFYVLLSHTEFPIQTFSREGILKRCIIHIDLIGDSYYFCLDQQLHLIVSDRGDSKVKIISNDGKLLNEISRHEGEFTRLAGVAIYPLGCVVTVDRSQKNMLQAFSPL